MSKFIELTHDNGSKLAVNTDLLLSFAPLGGDVTRGTALSFAVTVGDKIRVVRVQESYGEVQAKVGKPAR